MLATALVIAYSATTMFRKALKAPKEPFFRHSTQIAKAAALEMQESELTTSQEMGALAPRVSGATMSQTRTSEAQTIQMSDEATAPKGGPSASAVEAPSIVFSPSVIAKAIAIGLVTGTASGYVGLGGGFIMIPLMLMLFDMPMRLASGTSLIAVMILALPGTITQCMLGNVDYVIGIATACGTIPGALVGARLVTRLSERALRFTFAGFLFVAAILLVVKELGVLG
jgi:hypothetical protein